MQNLAFLPKFVGMKHNCLTIGLLTLAGTFIACTPDSNTLQPQTGYLIVMGEDSCRNISYSDEQRFAAPFRNMSLYYNGLALVCDSDALYGYVNDKGDFVIPARYNRATVFSEGLAWVHKRGDMPGAIDDGGRVKLSLRDAVAVRAFHEGHAAFATVKRGITLWGFINKKGEETIKARFKAVKNYCQGLAAVQDIQSGLWGYIDLSDSLRLPCRYQEACSYDEKGTALVRDDKGYLVIDRNGIPLTMLSSYEIVIPDGEYYRVCYNRKWGWCDRNGVTVIKPCYDDCRSFGSAPLAPVLIRGKWAYVDRNGNIAVKRQFADAYPFIDHHAAVKAGTVWGFIDENGRYVVNPQYNAIPADYLHQALGEGSVFMTLDLPRR